MSVPTNSYNNNSQNGSDVRLISSTASMTDSRQDSTILQIDFDQKYYIDFPIDFEFFVESYKEKIFTVCQMGDIDFTFHSQFAELYG